MNSVVRPDQEALFAAYCDMLHRYSTTEFPGGRHQRRMFATMKKAVGRLGCVTLDRAEPGTVFVWSDLHLGHRNIIGYTSRPFADVGEMDGALWGNWGRCVRPDDQVVIVGDVAMNKGVGPETWEKIRSAPGRRKWLVIGNHDLTGSGQLRTYGFDHTVGMLIVPDEIPLVFTHIPLDPVPDGVVNVHGHTHAELPGESRHINVSVEQIDYRPIELDRLRGLATLIAQDHYIRAGTTLGRILASGAMPGA